eukprot:1468545-Amphidinium_carterae.1
MQATRQLLQSTWQEVKATSKIATNRPPLLFPVVVPMIPALSSRNTPPQHSTALCVLCVDDAKKGLGGRYHVVVHLSIVGASSFADALGPLH